MTTYFTSDWHIGHKNIIRLCDRPFSDIDHMREALITNYNNVVTEHDTVYFLGDICWQYQDLPLLLSRLPGNKHLIVGNHDKCFKELYDPKRLPDTGKYINYYFQAGFESVCNYRSVVIKADQAMLSHDGMVYENQTYQVLLSHFPYRIDPRPTDYDDRYWDKRLAYSEAYLIHGHVHNKKPLFNGKNQFNVSVEATNYQPVSEHAIWKMIRTQELINSTFDTQELINSTFDNASIRPVDNTTIPLVDNIKIQIVDNTNGFTLE